MKVLFDTSTLIAAILSDHAAHGDAVLWLQGARAKSFAGCVSAHSLAEAYAVLTRLPRTPRVTAEDAWKLLDGNVVSHCEVVALGSHDYLDLIRKLSSGNLIGGIVYDGVIAKAAEVAKADILLTLNAAHFQRVVSTTCRVVTPTDKSVLQSIAQPPTVRG